MLSPSRVELPVPPEAAGERLDAFLHGQALPDGSTLSRQKARTLCELGAIGLDGVCAPSTARVDAGQTALGSGPLRASAGRVRLRSTSTVDVFGNRLTATAFGCTEGCPDGADETITTLNTPGRPAGDGTGWLWRTLTSRVTGWQDFLGPRKPTAVE